MDEPRTLLDDDSRAADAVVDAVTDAGLDLAAITAQLERDGVSLFCESYRELLACIDDKLVTAALKR